MFNFCDFTINMTDTSEIFWCSSFKEFFDTSQTSRDISSFFCDSSCMECTHRQLSTRFTNRLRRYDTNWRSDFDKSISCQVHTVTLLADSFMCLTIEHATYWNSRSIRCKNDFEKWLIDGRATRGNDRSFCIKEVFCEDFSVDLFIK